MHKNKKWIWEHSNYPHFTYNKDRLDQLILETTKEQGILEGEIKHLTQDESTSFQLETALNEIIYTSYGG